MKKKIISKTKRQFFVTLTFMVPIKFYEHIGHPKSLQENYYFKTAEEAEKLYDTVKHAKTENKTIIEVISEGKDKELVNVQHVVRARLNTK